MSNRQHRNQRSSEPLEPRILFTDLQALSWAYSLPAGYGPASITFDVANHADAGISGTLRLSLHLSNRPQGIDSGNLGTLLAEELGLAEIPAGTHAIRSASAYFDTDALTAGTYYVNALLWERAPGGTWERVESLTLEPVNVPNGPFPGITGYSHDGAISGFDAGDSIADATDLVQLLSPEGVTPFEEIVAGDPDVYRLVVPSERRIIATVSDHRHPVELLDETGTVIATGTQVQDSSVGSITQVVPAGTYFLRVSARPDVEVAQFSLSLVTEPLSPAPVPEPEPQPGGGGTRSPFPEARDIGLFPNTSISDSTTAEKPEDVFQFQVTNVARLTADLTGLSSNLNLQLLGDNGQALASSARSGTQAEKVVRVLQPGIYYLRVHGDAISRYSLAIATAAGAGSPTPTPTTVPGDGGDGDSIATARDLGTNPVTTLSGDVRDGHESEYFRFTLPARSSFNAVLGDLSSPVEIALLNGSGAPITRTRRSDATERQLTRTLAAGTYHVMVFHGSGDDAGTGASGYTLALQTTPLESPPTAPPPSASAPTATLKGPKAARKAYRFSVTYIDLDGIDLTTVSPDDILVTGPGEFGQTASILRTKVSRDGTRIIATYSIEPPSGTWPTGDDGVGVYQLNLQPGTIIDGEANAVAGGVLGTFTAKARRSR